MKPSKDLGFDEVLGWQHGYPLRALGVWASPWGNLLFTEAYAHIQIRFFDLMKLVCDEHTHGWTEGHTDVYVEIVMYI